MSSAMRGPDERRLTEALQQEAERMTPAPDALAQIQRRVAAPAVRSVRSHPTRRRIAFGVSVVGLAAALALVVGVGLRPDATPPPVQMPGPVPSAAPTYEAAAPRSQVDIYRVRLRDGSPALSVEAISTSAPFQPRAALDALFETAPLAAADNSAVNNGRNVVDSTSGTMDALVVDLSAADETTRPATSALGRAWVQAWVHTTQSAYNSELPVLIRLQGRPFRLYGLDTTRPIAAARLPEVRDLGIQMPRPGQSLVSPVQLAANLPSGEYQWKVVDTRGKTVYSNGVGGSAGYGTFTTDLQPGSYRAVVSGRAGSRSRAFRREVAFVVTGAATDPVVAPVTDPPTFALDTVAVYWATTDGRFVRELRTRRPAEELLSDYFSASPRTDAAARLEAANRVSSVTRSTDGVVVDFSRLEPNMFERPTALVYRQAQAFAMTVRDVVGLDLPVRVTRDGKPATLSGQVTLPASAPAKQVDSDADPYPQPVHEAGRAEIVGVSRYPAAPTSFVLYDAVTREARFQGTVPAVDPRTGRYRFAVAAPAGRYLLEVRSTDAQDRGWLSVADIAVG